MADKFPWLSDPCRSSPHQRCRVTAAILEKALNSSQCLSALPSSCPAHATSDPSPREGRLRPSSRNFSIEGRHAARSRGPPSFPAAQTRLEDLGKVKLKAQNQRKSHRFLAHSVPPTCWFSDTRPCIPLPAARSPRTYHKPAPMTAIVFIL